MRRAPERLEILVRPVQFFGMQLDQDTGAIAVVLREQEPPGRLLPIVIGGLEAVSIAAAVSGDEPSRPSTHDLMATMVGELGATVDAVEVTELRDHAFVAELAVSGPAGSVRLDSRPSDAIALALRVDAGLYVAESILEELGVVLPELPDEDQIEAELEEFRSRIDDEGADAFAEGAGDGPGDHTAGA
jgi:bifunctional DNase/RNase